MLTEAAEGLARELGRDAARKAARAALFERGDFTPYLHAKQLEARALLAAAYARGVRRGVFLVGRRGGKTRYFVADAFSHAIKHPGWRMPYAALTWESATGYVFPEAEALAEWAPAAIRPAIVDGEVRFANGSKIVVKGSDTRKKANDLRGPSAPRGYVDECGFNPVLDYLVKSVLSPQLLTTAGMLLMGSSPPDTPAHPFAAIYVPDARLRGSLVTYRSRDAPHITPEDLATLANELGGERSIDYRRECDIELLTDLSRAIVPEWYDHRDAIIGEVEAPTHRDWYVAADLGYKDLTASLLGWYDFTGARLVVEDERILTRPRSEIVQAETAAMERDNGADAVASRVADADLITIADLCHYQDPETPDALRWRLTRKDNLEAAVNALRLMVARHQLVIHPRCVTLLAHLEAGVWNENRTKFARSDVEGLGHYDALAALIYLVRSIDKTKNPFPAGVLPRPSSGKFVHPSLLEAPGRLKTTMGRKRR